jgi:hypothetical protein
MPKPKNEWLQKKPSDWGQPTNYHGFASIAHNQTYVVTLSCLGKQHHISYHKEQLEAARAYDAALHCLLPFTSPRARPNFPNDFETISYEDVTTLCPYALELFNELAERVMAMGLSIESLRTARESNIKIAVTAEAPEETRQARALRSYDALKHRISVAMAESSESADKISAKLGAVDLRKLPVVNKAVNDATVRLKEASLALLEAHNLLASQREYYEKIKLTPIE